MPQHFLSNHPDIPLNDIPTLTEVWAQEPDIKDHMLSTQGSQPQPQPQPQDPDDDMLIDWDCD